MALVAPLVSAQGFDENYEAYIGDYNNDGYEDIYVRQKPQIIILHGDVTIPIVLPAPVDDFVLVQDPVDHDFTIQAVTTINLSSWQLSAAELAVGDFDIDGIVDLLLKGVSIDVNGVFDQVIFAEAAGIPIQVTEVDEEFSMFFRDTYGWMLDEDYFDQAYVPVELPSYSYYIVQDYGYCFNLYGFIQSCFGGSAVIYSVEYILTDSSLNSLTQYLTDSTFYEAAGDLLESILETELVISLQDHDSGVIQGCYFYCDAYYSSSYYFAVYDLWVPTTEIVSVFDRENFSLDALGFSEIFEKVLKDGGIYAQTTTAIDVGEILEGVLGKPVLNDVLENGGVIGTIEDGYSNDEIAHDRSEAIQWSVNWFGEDDEDVDNSCGSAVIHQTRIWGSSPISQQIHFDRNTNQASPVFLTLSALPIRNGGDSGFDDLGETGTHNIGSSVSGNTDYRGHWDNDNPYKGWQLIYDSQGNLVTDPNNMGTYDFEKAGKPPHLRRDVTPWLEWGNSTLDTTSQNERISALYSGWTGIRGWVAVGFMKNFYRCTDFLP